MSTWRYPIPSQPIKGQTMTFQQTQILPREMTKTEAEQKDRSQPYRIHLNAQARDTFTNIYVVMRFLKLFIENEHMIPIYRELGIYSLLKSAVAFLTSAMERAVLKISAVQLRGMDAIWSGDINLYISTSKNIQSFLNVDGEVLQAMMKTIIQHNCQEHFCLKSIREAKKCPIKQMLDDCPSSGLLIQDVWKNTEVCPYSICKIEDQK